MKKKALGYLAFMAVWLVVVSFGLFVLRLESFTGIDSGRQTVGVDSVLINDQFAECRLFNVDRRARNRIGTYSGLLLGWIGAAAVFALTWRVANGGRLTFGRIFLTALVFAIGYVGCVLLADFGSNVAIWLLSYSGAILSRAG